MVNSEPHTGARPSVRVCVELICSELLRNLCRCSENHFDLNLVLSTGKQVWGSLKMKAWVWIMICQ
jgi:hypothetical protein